MKRISFYTALALAILLTASALQAQTASFPAPELLGRPTDHSVVVNVVADAAIEVYFMYGAASDNLDRQTDVFSSGANEPIEAVLDGLQPDARYYYQMFYRKIGAVSWIARDKHSFCTRKAPGGAFTFTIISDSHLGQYGGQTTDEKALYQQTLLNVRNDQPDFHIDLGDSSAMDPSPLGTGMTEAEADAAYRIQRPYLEILGGSVPVFLALGNHENEEGWNFDDVFTPPDQSLAVVGLKARKKYFPNPIPDDFYSGNEDPLPEAVGGDAYREDYYAWEWGDALFVVLDPYHYSRIWPSEGGSYGGEGMDREPAGDRWDWTLGIDQYLWFKSILENSRAKYKFVFSHHVAGGATVYGRGGISAAPFFEWGGRNADGSWGWDVERPASEGWDAPIHQMMAANGVTIFFHGHDHMYAREELDGIVYLEVPKPDDAGYSWQPYGYGHTEGLYPDAIVELTNSGHIRVRVSPSETTIDYVRSYLPGDGANGVVADTVTLPAPPAEIHAPDQPALVAPVNNAINVSRTPVLETAVADPDGDDLEVAFYLRKSGNGAYERIGGVSGISSGADAAIAVPVLDPAARYQWYATVSDGAHATTGPAWSFTTENIPSVYRDLTIEVGSGGGGSTEPAPGIHAFTENSTVEIKAIPAAGYRFDHWEGAVSNPSSAVASVLLNENKSVAAHFVKSAAKFEFGVVEVGGDPATVHLTASFTDPVVVSSIRYSKNSAPLVTRISSVSSSSFRIRLQNPSGAPVSPEKVSYLVVEKGVWNVDGVRFEAQSYLSAITDHDGGWVGESQTYGQNYANPVVVGQVMSENDSRWSSFWCQGSSRTSPPSSTVLKTGKMVGEDPVVARANETIGFIVFEAGHGAIGGIEFEAALGPNTVRGAVDSPPYVYDFNTPFVSTPEVVIAVIEGMNGPNGAWAQLHGSAPTTAKTLSLSVDEDQTGDSERNHMSERVGYVAFGSPANTPPTAGNDSGTTPEDAPVVIDVLANDTDPDGDPLSLVIAAQPSHGSAVVDGAKVGYTPAANFCGKDSFSYRANDGKGGSGEASVSVTVACVNDAPTAGRGSAAAAEDTAAAIDMLLFASDVDGDALTFAIETPPSHGSAVVDGAKVGYTPAANFCGEDSFVYRASDGKGGSGEASVSVAVACVNDAPVAGRGSAAAAEDTAAAIDMLLFASDVDGDALTFVIETPPSHGSAVVNGAIIGYTPAANFCGEDSFAYRASDGKGGSGEASVSVAVACVNDAPVAGHGSAVVAEGSTIAIDMLPFASDADGDALTFAIETPPSHGDVAADGMRVQYTPAVGFSGNDSFAYTAGDGQTNSNVGTVSISVVSNAAALSELSINPTSVRGGRSSTGTVLLSAPAPPGGVNVTLTDNSAYVSTPGSVAVPEGATAATFSISTRYVFWATTAAITASCNGAQRKAQLRVTR